MSKILEVYRILKDKLGEEEARIVAEAFEEIGGVRENLATKEDIKKLGERIESLQKEVKYDIENLRKDTDNKFERIEHRLWWIVGLVIVQWLSVILTILFR